MRRKFMILAGGLILAISILACGKQETNGAQDTQAQEEQTASKQSEERIQGINQNPKKKI